MCPELYDDQTGTENILKRGGEFSAELYYLSENDSCGCYVTLSYYHGLFTLCSRFTSDKIYRRSFIVVSIMLYNVYLKKVEKIINDEINGCDY